MPFAPRPCPSRLALVWCLLLAACHSSPPRPPAAPAATSEHTAGPERKAEAAAKAAAVAGPHPAAPTPASASASAPNVTAPASPLAGEQRWLARLYQGTPVRVAGEPDGAVRVELPLLVAFDARSDQPTPGLRSVLQHLAQSLARQPRTRLGLAAPGQDATDRQQRMRLQLIDRGVAAHRLTLLPSVPDAGTVSLRLALAPAAISRLKDRDLQTRPRAVLPPAAH